MKDFPSFQLDSTEVTSAKTWSHSSLQVSNSSEKFVNSYQPGGTLTAVVGDWTSRIIDRGGDPYGMGHWSSITLRTSVSARRSVGGLAYLPYWVVLITQFWTPDA